MSDDRIANHPWRFFIGNCVAFLVLFIGASLLRDPAFALLLSVFVTATGIGFISRRRALLNSTVPAAFAAFVLVTAFLGSASTLYPIGVSLLIGSSSVGSIALVALLGGLTGTGLRRIHRKWRSKEPKQTTAPDPMKHVRTISILILAFYVQMQIVVPLAQRSVMAESEITSDQYFETYDPEENVKIVPDAEESVPEPVRRVPLDGDMTSLGVIYKNLTEEEIKAIEAKCKITGCNAEEEKEKANNENKKKSETPELTPEQKQLEELRNKNLSVNELLELYQKGKISAKELGALIAEGMKNKSISVWDLIKNGKSLLSILGKELGPLAGALAAVLLQPGNPKAWNALIDAFDKTFGGIFHSIKAFKDRAVNAAKEAIKWAMDHPWQALGIGALTILAAIGCAVWAPLALILSIGSVVILGVTMIAAYMKNGWAGVRDQIISSEAMAMLKAGDIWGFAGAAVFDVGLFVAMNFSDVAAFLGVAAKAPKILSSVDDLIAIAHKVTDIRVSIDMLQAAGKLSDEAGKFMQMLVQHGYQESMKTGDLMAAYFLYGEEMFIKSPAFIKGVAGMTESGKLGIQAQKGAVAKAFQDLMYFMGTKPDYVGIMGQGMTRVDEVVYGQVGKNLGMNNHAVETFIKRGMSVVDGNPQVAKEVGRMMKSFENLPPSQRVAKEAEFIAVVGKFQGNENTLQKVLTNSKTDLKLKTLKTIGEDKNLLYLINKGGNSKVDILLKKIDNNQGKNPYKAFGPGKIEHILEGDPNYPGGFHFENSNGRGVVLPGTQTKATNGVYTAEVLIDGVAKPAFGGKSTFFPKEWSREKVLDTITKIHSNRSTLTGITQTNGNTKYIDIVDGVKIEVITGRDGKIITANPSWPQ